MFAEICYPIPPIMQPFGNVVIAYKLHVDQANNVATF